MSDKDRQERDANRRIDTEKQPTTSGIGELATQWQRSLDGQGASPDR